VPAAAQRFGIDEFAKTLGLLGIGIYAVLFLAYQRYYSVLGIRPEEIGVSQLFLLSRSAAFLILVALPLIYIAVPMGAGIARRRRFPPRIRGREERAMRALSAVLIMMIALFLIYAARSESAASPYRALRYCDVATTTGRALRRSAAQVLSGRFRRPGMAAGDIARATDRCLRPIAGRLRVTCPSYQ
jgi:hypothetical protein